MATLGIPQNTIEVLQKRADTLFTTVFQKMPIKIRLTDNGDSKNV